MAAKIGDVERKVLHTSERHIRTNHGERSKTQQVVYLTATGKKKGKMKFSSVTKHEAI